ncbi:MAG: hypothetical protein N2Z74_01540, partial [Syntrophales bacterium]|nr:hypothetical protein [Syntrophales bacterium]
MIRDFLESLPRRPTVFLLIFAVVVVLLGYGYYEKQKEDLVRTTFQELGAIADLKIGQIVHWQKERRGDAEVLMKRPFFIGRVHEYIKTGCPSTRLRAAIHEDLEVLRKQYDYKDIILLDGNLRPIFSFGSEEVHLSDALWPAVHRSVAEGRVVFTDLHRVRGDRIRIAMAAPLRLKREGGLETVGVCVFSMDPHDFLYPLIQSWPTPSATAETLLVAPSEQEVVFLNELRHRRDTALKLRFPITDANLPAAMAARGVTGPVLGRDYRGVEVLAVIREVPHLPWRLVAKIDREEVFADVRTRAGILG